MANYACVAIGINRYQFLPPLSYGQADAQALRQFLVCQANLPSSQCLLLTDTSPLVGDKSTYPSRENIVNWLEGGDHSRNGTNGVSRNWRWFFFSGYGVSWEEMDYLMPIDGNPDDIPGTGISVRSLFESLKAQGSENLLVLLDINRSLGLQSETAVGARAVELAHQMGITLVLSSQLNQFSHEATALGCGLFTAALLEALRYYHTDTTLEHLEQYLHARLPELSQHHWRPIQTPLAVIPSEEIRQQRILPTADNLLVNQKIAADNSRAFSSRTKLDAQEAFSENSRNGTAPSLSKTSVSTVETRPLEPRIPATTAPLKPTASTPGAMVPYPNKHSESNTNQTPWWQPLLFWGSTALILALMIAAVLLRNRAAFTNKQAVEKPTNSTAEVSPTTLPLATGTPSAVALPNASSRQAVTTPQASPPSRLQANQAALEQAKRLLRPNQVSLFNKAIVQARNVKPGDPLYQQAKQDIRRWSGVILDIAQGRAEKGNFGAAIAAAQMVPKDDPSVYAKAQRTINQWKGFSIQQQQNQSIIQAAKKQIQPNQAWSYRDAITTLSKIPYGQPGYAEAQQLTTQWSQTIYLLAQSRAAQGKLPEAIKTAGFVPTSTPYFEAAQKAIAKWKQGKP
jgi:uncharacterized caspase-like protein